MLSRLRTAARRAAHDAIVRLRRVPSRLRTFPQVAIARLRRAPSYLRARARPAAHVAIVLAGIAAGLLLALPLPNVDARCPAHGEGFNYCYVQKSVLPAIMIVLAGGLLGQFIARTIFERIPAWRRRVREHGERREGGPETREDPPYRKDPFLLASTWGVKEGRPERRHPASRLLDRLLRR